MSGDGKLEGVDLYFVSGAKSVREDDDVRLVGVRGSERLSRLFRFDLLLSRPSGPFNDDDLDALLQAECAVGFGTHHGDVVFGILSEIRAEDTGPREPARYVATMVPAVWPLTLSRTDRVFQDTTVPKMVEEILGAYNLSKGKDFDLLISGSPRSLEYVIQYQESDWDFIQRWLENEGYFYWFEHTDDAAKLVVADDNGAATAIEDPDVLFYREKNNLSTGGKATVWDFGLLQRRIAARVALVDYNYRTPHVPMVVTADVDTKRGFGSVFYFGEHFKDKTQGAALAKVRAERIACGRRVFSGSTDCSRFRVGHSFELEHHPQAVNDREYLITAVEHRVGRPFGDEAKTGDQGSLRYHATFEAIPLDVPFRPEQVTPWPSILGVINGHIESDGSGEVAQIDDQGRYRVKLPFDLGGAQGSKASRWIRMAQPYAGAGYGAHFPLHKGAEVLIAHIDGDPDRPVIVGAVPNPHTASPSTGSNATQSVIQTASGIRVEMEDRQS